MTLPYPYYRVVREMPAAGWKKNPETGKHEAPLPDGSYSWELPSTSEESDDQRAVMSSEPVDERVEEQGEFSLDSSTGFTVRPTTEVTADRAARLSFPLTADGKIDFSKTSQKNLNKLRSAVQDGEAKAQLGLLARQLFQPHQLKWFLGFIGKAEAMLVSSTSKGKIEQSVADEAFEFSSDELDQLAKPATAIANKHIGRLMLVSEHFEEFQLASMLVMLTLAKYRLCVQLQNERNLQRARPNGGVQQPQNRSIV